MTHVRYEANEKDQPILEDITDHLRKSLNTWYGENAFLQDIRPEIRSYRNSFILRYSIVADTRQKHILIKIRRDPKMTSLWRAVEADIHTNIPSEYGSLQFLFNQLASSDEDLCFIRPLDYVAKYHAIIMEEYPAQALRQILVNHHTAPKTSAMQEVIDAATKTGKWLRYFHHHVHRAKEMPYSNSDILSVVGNYARRLHSYSHGRVTAQTIIEAFSNKLQYIQIESMTFAPSHVDMTCDNVLYSVDHKICIIDLKTHVAPIYSAIGLIITHPETFKSQIFSDGMYFSPALLREYRAAILAGYFDKEVVPEIYVKLFSTLAVVDKWVMYERLMSRYKGIKRILAIPVSPFVTRYFYNLMKKHLNSIQDTDTGHILATGKQINPAEN